MTDYIHYLPPAEIQRSSTADFMDCVAESAIHCIESQEIKRFGFTRGWSERALAKMSGTTRSGNDASVVLATIQEFGLIPDALWPSEPTPNMTWDEFYAPIPPEILAQAVKLPITFQPGASLDLPVWTEIALNAGTTLHMVEGLNSRQYFDSYKQYVKTFTASTPIKWQGQLILGDYMKLVNDNGTVFIVGTAGKLGIADGPSLEKIKQIEPGIENGSTAGIPQIGTLTHNDAFIIHG